MHTQEILTPTGINYDCSGCGKCCSGWIVPMTPSDFERIDAVDWSKFNPLYENRKVFRELNRHESENTPYTHSIVSATGTCPFLVDNLCFIHKERGMEFKPSMCQLFPYYFNETPTGIYTTVSFVSMAVIYNTGTPLSEQQDNLQKKYIEFKRLYPDFKPNWSVIKLTVGQPLSWEDYLRHEEVLLKYLNEKDLPITQTILTASNYLTAQVAKAGAASPSPNKPNQRLKSIDRHILATFHKIYFPSVRLKRGEWDFNWGRFLYQRIFGSTRLSFAGKSFTVEELHEFPFPENDQEINNLIYRYIYSLIFGKKYFGAGFCQVSVIAGFNHMAMLVALLKLNSKGLAKLRGAPVTSLVDVVASVKQLERQIGETKLDKYSAAAWELLFFSSKRAERLIANS